MKEYKDANRKKYNVKKVEKEQKDARKYLEDLDAANKQLDPHFYATLMKQMEEEENER